MSDTSQGDGWWIASDGKWYPPEQHPDYVAPTPEPSAPAPTPEPVWPSDQPSSVSETVVMPAAEPPQQPRPQSPQPPQPVPPTPAPEPTPPPTQQTLQTPVPSPNPGPAFTPPGPPTQTYSPTAGADPNYNLPEGDSAPSSKGKLLLGVGALVLVAGLGFLAFRFFTGGDAGGADSPESAVEQLIASVNERDAVGFVDVFDPDEIEAWFGSFAPALSSFERPDESGEDANELTDVYESIFSSFGYTISGPGGEPVTYEVEPLDSDGRISRVRIEAIDFEIMADTSDRALIVGFGDQPTALDVSQLDGARAEFRDERSGLASTLFAPGEDPIEEFAPGGHIDLVTVQKDGKWYVSMGYTFLEIARNGGAFDGFPRPDFGRGYELVDSQTGGAESPEAVVQEMFTSLETLDYESIIELTDPFGTPYLHDYQPLIDSQVDQGARQEAVQDAALRFDDLELGVSEWEGRTLVTTNDIRATANGGSLLVDTNNWCVTAQDEFDSSRVCLEEGIRELLFELDSDMNPRDFIPEEAGFVVVERNGRWYLDPLGTMGFYADQIAEIGMALTEDLPGNPTSEFGEFFVFEGPIARQGAPATAQAVSGSAAVAVDLTDYPTVGSDFSEFHVAVARVVTDAPGTFVGYDEVPLTGEDWIVVFDSTEADQETAAVAANTGGSVDVELFEVQVTEVGVDGYSGQLGGQGRPQVFVFSPDTEDADIVIEGASADSVRPWERNGVVLPRDRSSSFINSSGFTVVYGEPGATFTLDVQRFEEPEPEPEPTPEPEPEPDPTPEPDPDPEPTPEDDPVTIDDTLAALFGGIVEPEGYLFSETFDGGYFDGCNGPDDPDVQTFIFEADDFTDLMIITPYPDDDRALDAFVRMLDISSPCPAFEDLVVNSVEELGPNDILIEWQFVDDPDSLTYEHYRLSGTTIVAAVNDSLEDLNALQLPLLDIWG